MSKKELKPVAVFGSTGFTTDGGYYVTLTNKTSAASVKGTIVMAAAGTGNAVDIATANTPFSLGVIYESGVADGSPVKVVVSGRAQVLLRDGSGATRGYWCTISNLTDGRMIQSAALPLLVADYAAGIGISLQDAAADVNVLAWVMLQFN
jgi:hypothetical protein